MFGPNLNRSMGSNEGRYLGERSCRSGAWDGICLIRIRRDDRLENPRQRQTEVMGTEVWRENIDRDIRPDRSLRGDNRARNFRRGYREDNRCGGPFELPWETSHRRDQPP